MRESIFGRNPRAVAARNKEEFGLFARFVGKVWAEGGVNRSDPWSNERRSADTTYQVERDAPISTEVRGGETCSRQLASKKVMRIGSRATGI
jgi:hypothetical protein